jgi:N-acetylmuramoyl-L-alanine amidase
MIIGIDPGHGGIDPGAVGPSGVREADITLAISLLLADKLRERGHTVILTRQEDDAVALRDRADILNSSGCDLVLSIHINACDNPEPDYISAWICGRGGKAEKIANGLAPELAAATGWPDGGVRLAKFYILRKTDSPAVLLEIGFISNPEQERQLLEREVLNQLVNGIVVSLDKYSI